MSSKAPAPATKEKQSGKLSKEEEGPQGPASAASKLRGEGKPTEKQERTVYTSAQAEAAGEAATEDDADDADVEADEVGTIELALRGGMCQSVTAVHMHALFLSFMKLTRANDTVAVDRNCI